VCGSERLSQKPRPTPPMFAFDAPIEPLYVWTGLSVVSAVVAGLAVGLPTTPPPNAASVADAVDAVAASPHPSTAEHPIDAAAVRVGPRRIALRGADGTSHATFVYGPVVPAGDGPLERVLSGVPPDRAFESPSELRRAASTARNRTPTWRPVDGEIDVRKIVWGNVNVTLVGA